MYQDKLVYEKRWSVPNVKQVRTCVPLLCLGVPVTGRPLSIQALFDMSQNDSHPHPCHSFLYFPTFIFYLCSSAL